MKTSLLWLALLLGSSCTKIPIKDTEWYADATPLGAIRFRTLTAGSQEIGQESWDQMRFGMVCTSPEHFAEWKKAVLKLCRETRMCSWEVEQAVESFSERVEKASARAKGVVR